MGLATRIRVLMAKTSLDGHWQGVAVVTAALRDAGMEVIYAGTLKPQEIAETAEQEDVDVIGLNIGGRYQFVEELMQALRAKGLDHLLVVAGGTVPREDIPVLKGLGIAEVFPPGSTLDSIVGFIKRKNDDRGASSAGGKDGPGASFDTID